MMKYIFISLLISLAVYYRFSGYSHQTNKQVANEEVEVDSKVSLRDKNLQQAFAKIVKNREISENNINNQNRLPASLDKTSTVKEEEASLAVDDYDEVLLDELPPGAKANAIANLQSEIRSDEMAIESLRSRQKHEEANAIEEELYEKKKLLDDIQLN